MKAKIKPFKYQKEGVWAMERFLREGGGALLADDMGLGKTLQSLWLLKRQKVGTMFPAVVVTPASVKYGWEHAALSHIGVKATVLEGRKTPTSVWGPRVCPDIMIINPDILLNWATYLIKLNVQTVIMDECQYFTNPKSKRTKAMFRLARVVPNRIALSGTPLTNRPAELWPVLHMLRPDIFNSFLSFAEHHCDPRRRPWGWEFKGATNIGELHETLKSTCMIRRRKEDVLKDLPPKVRQVIPIEIKDMKEYNDAQYDFLRWLKDNYGQSTSKRAKKAAAVTKIGYLLRLSAKLKARDTVGWINRFLEENPEEKLVVFANHRKMISLLQRRIAAKHVAIDGSVSKRDRHVAKETFIRKRDVRVLIGNMKAMGTGVDGLQEVCNNACFTELWWRPGDHVQAEDRVYRIGTTKTAWIRYFVAGGTIEESLCQIIRDKQSVIHSVLDGDDPEELDVFDQLLSTLEAK
jgi:SWI/SNF-related matrix-associated actin-dependent regulator 1 of chromatin subfamily A